MSERYKVINSQTPTFITITITGWFHKKKISTLWPKEWSLEKIKRITKEASENVYFNVDRKFRGTSKEGYQVEFFSEVEGKIDNAYLFTENLK